MTVIAALCLACAGCPSFTDRVPMRDGTRLATDVYLPVGEGPWPVVLHQTTYGRLYVPAGKHYVDHGVAVVAQDLRGFHGSEGSPVEGLHKFATDGYDTVTWIGAQPWSNGRIAAIGGSACALPQYAMAPTAPPGLVAVTPGAATPAMYNHVFFLGGAFRQALVRGWTALHGDSSMLDLLAKYPYNDGFWNPLQVIDQFGDVNVPGLHTAGWYDIFQQGTLDGFMGYQNQGGSGAAGQQKLVVGPWTHMGFGQRRQGELTFPKNAVAAPFDNATMVFLNDHLEVGLPEVSQTAEDIPTVQYYVMGAVDEAGAPGNTWRSADQWPVPAAPVRLYLQPGGALAPSCPQGEATGYVFDPNDPSETICGGNLALRAGPCDQRPVEARDDVVVFETDPLTSPMEITGRVYAHLFVSIDRLDADVMVRMTDVYPDGRSMLITDGAHRLATRGLDTHLTPLSPGEVVEATVDLWSTSIVINEGHRLRISVTSSNYPRFGVNQNNGLDYPQNIEGEGYPVAVEIHHDGAHSSYIELPDPNRAPSDYLTCGG